MNKLSPDTFDRLEAIANRHRLAATTPKERCLYTFALMAIQTYRRRHCGQANGREVAAWKASEPKLKL